MFSVVPAYPGNFEIRNKLLTKEQFWKGRKTRKFRTVSDASKGFCSFFNFDLNMGICTALLLHAGKKGEELETLELVTGCKQAFRSQQREQRDHSKSYLRRKT